MESLLENKKKAARAYLKLNDKFYPVYEGHNPIGTNPDSVLNLKNLNVSEYHAVITIVENCHCLSDFKSSNGTILDDEILNPFQLYNLNNGASIKFGDVSCTYKKLIVTKDSKEIFRRTKSLPEGIWFKEMPPTQVYRTKDLSIKEMPAQVFNFSDYYSSSNDSIDFATMKKATESQAFRNADSDKNKVRARNLDVDNDLVALSSDESPVSQIHPLNLNSRRIADSDTDEECFSQIQPVKTCKKDIIVSDFSKSNAEEYVRFHRNYHISDDSETDIEDNEDKNDKQNPADLVSQNDKIEYSSMADFTLELSTYCQSFSEAQQTQNIEETVSLEAIYTHLQITEGQNKEEHQKVKVASEETPASKKRNLATVTEEVSKEEPKTSKNEIDKNKKGRSKRKLLPTSNDPELIIILERYVPNFKKQKDTENEDIAEVKRENRRKQDLDTEKNEEISVRNKRQQSVTLLKSEDSAIKKKSEDKEVKKGRERREENIPDESESSNGSARSTSQSSSNNGSERSKRIDTKKDSGEQNSEKNKEVKGKRSRKQNVVDSADKSSSSKENSSENSTINEKDNGKSRKKPFAFVKQEKDVKIRNNRHHLISARDENNKDDSDTEENKECIKRRGPSFINLRKRKVLKPKVVTMIDNVELKSLIKKLRGSVVDTVDACTVLVTENVTRSLELLCAIAQGKPICSPEWLRESERKLEFVDPWDYILVDEKAEKKWKFSLRESLNRSTKCKLENYTFQIIVNNSADVLKGAIEACGGTCVTDNLPKCNTDNLIIVSTKNNTRKFSRIAKQNSNIIVVEAEAIFDGTLRQEFRFEKHLIYY